MGNYLSSPITTKRSEWGTITTSSQYTYPYAVSAMQGWRKTMEDTHIILPASLSLCKPNISLFCIFDGHGGTFSSKFARDKFVLVLRETEEFLKFEQEEDEMKSLEYLKEALTESFIKMDEKLQFYGRVEGGCTTSMTGNRDMSGSTALVVVLLPNFIICANAGDCRAVLTKQAQEEEREKQKYLAIPLSHDHRPSNKSEEARILGNGGKIIHSRINGDLAVSRGFGDFRFKDSQKEPKDQIVTCLPEIIVQERDNENDQFLIMGCDGIWDVKKADLIANVISNLIHEKVDVAFSTEGLLDFCLKHGSKDNMSAIIVVLPGLDYQPTKKKDGVEKKGTAHDKIQMIDAVALADEKKEEEGDVLDLVQGEH